jgi:hypothetical protein
MAQVAEGSDAARVAQALSATNNARAPLLLRFRRNTLGAGQLAPAAQNLRAFPARCS